MVSFHVQNMSETWQKLNRNLFTDNISKLRCVTQRSPTTHKLHEYETDKRDSMTSYVTQYIW